MGRIRNPGKKPKGGWGLMVIPLTGDNSSKAKARAKREGKVMVGEKPYVAYADGTRREINADEEEMFRRRKIRPARKLL